MIEKAMDYFFSWMIKRLVSNYRFEFILSEFWVEYRRFYNEDNFPSAMASVVETLEDCEKSIRIK